VDGRLPLTQLLLRWRSLHPTPAAAAIAASTAAALRAPAVGGACAARGSAAAALCTAGRPQVAAALQAAQVLTGLAANAHTPHHPLRAAHAHPHTHTHTTTHTHTQAQAAPALLPPSSGVLPGLPLLLELACSFGNTVTLPLLYLAAMLPAAEAGRAIGIMSLFHAAWSPCLWVFGYARVQAASRQQRQGGSSALPRPAPGWVCVFVCARVCVGGGERGLCWGMRRQQRQQQNQPPPQRQQQQQRQQQRACSVQRRHACLLSFRPPLSLALRPTTRCALRAPLCCRRRPHTHTYTRVCVCVCVCVCVRTQHRPPRAPDNLLAPRCGSSTR
jgi:hypothetical protein